MSLLDDAVGYLNTGLCVLPAIRLEKRPALPNWKQYQGRLPTERQVRAWFTGDGENAKENACCLLTGAISGNLELIDFDCDGDGKTFERWRAIVSQNSPGLYERLVIERSQSGGWHVVYRCESSVPGNRKLAQRRIPLESGDPIEVGGKQYVPRRVGDHFELTCTLIETRGEGGLFLCAPTPGYVLEQGSLDRLPLLTNAERSVLIEAARALNEVAPADSAPCPGIVNGRPGDGFNERGDVRELLRKHGWRQVRGGDNEHWRRPGKTNGWSATLKNGVFHVFSTNAAPFEAERSYAPFSVYALLEHAGDFKQAAMALRDAGYGETHDDGVDLSGILAAVSAEPADVPEPSEPTIQYVDPGPLPLEMCRIPGFISEVMNHTLATAPYPNVPLAFCGALALQATLAGRKVRDAGDNRTNLYILGLANSGAGKDHPRKINQQILIDAGLSDCIGDSFASGEGIEDRLFLQPTILFQTDEIDGLMAKITQAKDARQEGVMNVLLKMYTSASALYPMRVKAGKEPGIIDQPSLSIFGTAIPTHYYEALSLKMLTNGFFARIIVVESGKRGEGQDAVARELPSTVRETAHWWRDFAPGDQRGNLLNWHPCPHVVEYSKSAEDLLREFRLSADREYSLAEDAGEAAAMAIWARANEKARRLALIHACSENHKNPVISEQAARWASAFVAHQTRRMLFMASEHVSETEFDAKRKKLVEVLRQWKEKKGDAWMPFWRLNRKLPWSERDHEEIRTTLLNQRIIDFQEKKTGGTPKRLYRML